MLHTFDFPCASGAVRAYKKALGYLVLLSGGCVVVAKAWSLALMCGFIPGERTGWALPSIFVCCRVTILSSIAIIIHQQTRQMRATRSIA